MLSSPMQLTSDNPTSLSFKGKSPLPFGDVGRPAVVDSDFFRLEECCLTVRPGSASSKLIDEFVTADLDAGMVRLLEINLLILSAMSVRATQNVRIIE